jgi:hypothetical protein
MAAHVGSDISILSKDILAFQNKKYTSGNIIKLRSTFPGFSDEDLARFLIARNDNLGKASEMLAAHVAWRASNLPIYKESCLGEILKGKVYVYGTDKEGHPLVHFRPRLNDMETRDVDEMGRMALWWCEVIFSQIPPHLSKATLLVNRTGGENNADVPFIRLLAGVFQANHPERLHKAIIYPSGMVFWVLWNMLKYLADPVTQAKVSPLMWFSGVQELVDDKFIPREIGGESDYEAEFDTNKVAIVGSINDPYTPPAKAEAEKVVAPSSLGGNQKLEVGEGAAAADNAGTPTVFGMPSLSGEHLE